MATDAAPPPAADEPVSPTNKAPMGQTVDTALSDLKTAADSVEMRADPDAQATVTDFLDFTEYLPSDIVRSLTLIGKLDQNYADHSSKLNELTTTWSQLPGLPLETRPQPVELRAEISETLRRAMASRMYTHAEATKMTDNINRHYSRAQNILAKLQTTLENFPAALEEQKSPAATIKSPQLTRTPKATAPVGEDGKKVRQKRVPRIIIPGEVLAPNELNFDAYSDSDDSSSPEPESPTRRTPSRQTPGALSRIKLVNRKTPKVPKTPGHGPGRPPKPVTVSATSGANVVLQPPPDNALPGSADAPWLQLTAYELAKLRKKMKKNAFWTPSDTMIARELKALGRGPEAYRAAKKKAEDEGKEFNCDLPAPVGESGSRALPEGAISVDTLEDDISLSNKGMKLNEAKKLKREAMAKQAVEEAEEGDRKWAEAARRFIVAPSLGTPNPETPAPAGNGRGNGNGGRRSSTKRKRDDVEEDEGGPEESATEAQGGRSAKRVKTETPVPPPQLATHPSGQTRSVTPILPTSAPQSITPVPIPLPRRDTAETSAPSSVSPSAPPTAAPAPETTEAQAGETAAHAATVSAVPTKPPAEPVAPSTTGVGEPSAPITPSTRDQPRRETRQGTAKKQQQIQPETHEEQQQGQEPQPQPQQQEAPAQPGVSRDHTPAPPEPTTSRRPTSRGKAASQEPGVSLATERPRRASTARNTPAPEPAPQKTTRGKRPAPGIVSSSGQGANSAVGKRKAAPRRKARGRREKGQVEMEEVDDEGNAIPGDEPRYCLCNRVSFGTMIECDNADVSPLFASP